jgi:hypothetical protein
LALPSETGEAVTLLAVVSSLLFVLTDFSVKIIKNKLIYYIGRWDITGG